MAKFRRQIASALTPKPSKHTTEIWEPEPFDTEIVILDFVAENKSSPKRASSAPPSVGNDSNQVAQPDVLETFGPFDTNIVIMDFVQDDRRRQPASDQKLGHSSSRATLADPSRSAYWSSPPSSAANLLADDTSFRITTPNEIRPATAGGDGEHSQRGVGRAGAKVCQCHCGWARSHVTNAKLGRCGCWCKNCRCRTRKLSKKLMKVLKNR